MRRIFAALLLLATPLFARVARVEITERTDIRGGTYERIAGQMFFALDPANPHNQPIVDVDRASRNAAGEVEFSADFEILRPKTGSEAMFVEIANRGGRSIMNPDREDFLIRHGFTVASVGWQFDIRHDPRLIRLYAPVAKGISGKVRSDFVVPEKAFDHPLGHVISGQIGGTGYPVADSKERSAALTERKTQTAPRRTIPRRRWRFTDPTTIHLDSGFVPGRIYEVIYTAKDPAVVGTGFAAVRDFVSYAKHDPKAIVSVKRAYGFGISQTGRFLRHMVYQGFNADEEGRLVFDAVMPVVAGAGRGNFNHRFAQPSRDAQPLSPLFYAVDIPPFTDAELLEKAVAEKVVPQMMYVNTSYEFWSRGESLTYVPDGVTEVPLPPNVRLYTIAGMSHIGGPWPPAKADNLELLGQNPRNPSNYWPVLHAMFIALDQWARDNVEPPPSRYPHVSELTTEVAGAPVKPYQPYKFEVGPEPPRVTGSYVALVPRVDRDGNEIAGIRLPHVAVPVATWTGWNPRDPKIGFPNERASFVGSFLPFPKSRVAELYRDRYDYLGRYTAATMQLVRERYLVADDLASILTRGQELWDFATR
ncbi:MAG TPA: alpha/beta hydrolase domain-containing protein [Thermoanaerobaculia bacterium]|nr:alpha/beta hydrolase domain-containing protein [Thermoanaerobaculia bacterium]